MVNFEDKTLVQVGWYVGYVEKGKDIYCCATNIDIDQDEDLAIGIDLTHRCFADLKLL